MQNNQSISNPTQNLDKSWQRKGGLLAWSIFITSILYYCYAYLLRVYPSIMEQDLLTHFHITAGAFGNLTAYYYYAYAPLQLPVGVAVDRYGARRSLITACCISIAGILTFTIANSLALAEVGRFMIGFGSAFAYVTVLKLATIWLPRRFFATATGIATGSGMLAAVVTDIYITKFQQAYSYHATLYLCVFIGAILLALIISLVHDKKNDLTEADGTDPEAFAVSYSQLGHYLIKLAKNPQMWIIGIIGSLMYLPASVFMDVWGIPYFTTTYHFSAEDAGLAVSLVTLGWVVFSPITGAISDRLGTRKMPLVISTFSGALLASLIFFVPDLPKDLLFLLLFLLGVSCASHPLTFTLSKENNDDKISGTSIAFANCIIMLGGVIFQPLVGKLLDIGWTGATNHGIRVYSAHDFTMALSILPIGLLIAGILTLAVKETFHRAVERRQQAARQ